MSVATLAPGHKGYLAWQAAILDDETLREHAADARKQPGGGVDVRIVAYAIARHGRFGLNCYPSAETVAAEVGCSVRTVKAYRTYLRDAGWFKVRSLNAGHGRAVALDISLPAWGWCVGCQGYVQGYSWEAGDLHTDAHQPRQNAA